MFDDESLEYHVVVNFEEQYSIWPVGRDLPAGWRAVKGPMARQAALDFIDETWTDIRPASLRRQLDELQVHGRRD